MRVFFNTINHQLDLIRAAGVDAGTEQRETEHEIVLTIRIPKSSLRPVTANPSSFTKARRACLDCRVVLFLFRAK